MANVYGIITRDVDGWHLEPRRRLFRTREAALLALAETHPADAARAVEVAEDEHEPGKAAWHLSADCISGRNPMHLLNVRRRSDPGAAEWAAFLDSQVPGWIYGTMFDWRQPIPPADQWAAEVRKIVSHMEAL